MDESGIGAVDADDLGGLGVVKAEEGVHAADGRDDAVPLEAMHCHLTQVGGVAHGRDGHVGDALAHYGGQKVQVVADDDVGVKLRQGAVEPGRKGRLELPHHLGCEVTVARGGIGHLVRHAAHVEGQLGRVEAHREDERLGRQRVGGVAIVYAADDGRKVAGRNLGRDGLGEEGPTARAVGLLGADVQDPQASLPFRRTRAPDHRYSGRERLIMTYSRKG